MDAYRDLARTTEGGRAGLSVHLHPGRHRAGRLGPPPRGRRARPIPGPARAGPPATPSRWAIARSPGGSGCPRGRSRGLTGSWARSGSTLRGSAAISWSARSGVGPSYQLAVVHDDATMGVTEVIRGDDLVPSTPRQILLYRALGWESASVRPRPARRRPRRPEAGQARRLDQAGDPPGSGRRPSPAGRLARAVLRLGRWNGGRIARFLARPLRPLGLAIRTVGRHTRGRGRDSRPMINAGSI